MTVKWRDIRATIEGRGDGTVEHANPKSDEIDLAGDEEHEEEREAVLTLVDDLQDICSTISSGEGGAASFMLEDYQVTRYLDILSDEAVLVEGHTELRENRTYTPVPQDANAGAFAVHDDEWTTW